MKDILTEAWLHNLHRGYDAAGYMMVDSTNAQQLFKAPGTAVDILQNHIYPKELPLAKTLAAHTRNPTLGASAKENRNNHPVIYRGCNVIHNGTIQNDTIIKNQFKIGSETLPDVDSAAIAVLFAQLSDPYNVHDIKDALSTLQGGFAIHVIWDNFPGLSLIAKGTNSPLIMAYTKEALVYGSEVQSAWHIIDAMKLDPNTDEWQWADLYTNKFVLVQDGVPIEYGVFNGTSTVTANKNQYFMQRLLPKEGSRKSSVIYETDNTYDFANNATHSMVSAKNPKVIYTRKDGPTDDKITYPLKEDTSLMSVLSEADKVYENGTVIHAFFGDIEVVMTTGRIVKDVYNHKVFKNNARWARKLKPKVSKNFQNVVKDENMGAFLKAKGGTVKDIPQYVEQYQYVIDIDANKKKKAEDKKKPPLALLPSETNLTTTQENGTKSTDSSEYTTTPDDTDALTHLNPKSHLTWKNIAKATVPHESNNGLLFLADGQCPKHDVPFKQHDKVEECKLLLHAASYTMAAVSGVDLYTYFGDDLIVDWDFSIDYCELNGGKDSDERCWWTEHETVNVFNVNSYWTITVADRCYMCGTRRSLREMPWYFQHIQVTGRKEVGRANAY